MGRSIGTSSREIELQVLIESRSASSQLLGGENSTSKQLDSTDMGGQSCESDDWTGQVGESGWGSGRCRAASFRSRPSRLLSVTCRPPAHPPTCSSLHLFTCSPLLLPTCPTAHLFRSRRGPSGATWERARDAGRRRQASPTIGHLGRWGKASA
jgi:hypothetical protein